MPLPILFLDDGGVMNDNAVRAPQWRAMVGDYLAPVLGGQPQAWGDANFAVMEKMYLHDAWQVRLRANLDDYASFDAAYLLDWLNWMCEIVGVPAPPPEAAIALALQVSASICPRVRSAFPGAADAIRTLHDRGYTLHNASGESSRELAGYLESMGVRHCFGRLYGPDLINHQKAGSAYYTRLLADCGVSPQNALILDDSPMVIPWIAEAGARPLLVNAKDGLTSTTIPALSHLPAWLNQFA
jgi:FMN phosphatase YigB (HAD superfamily)